VRLACETNPCTGPSANTRYVRDGS
jgi:hypothetical protein